MRDYDTKVYQQRQQQRQQDRSNLVRSSWHPPPGVRRVPRPPSPRRRALNKFVLKKKNWRWFKTSTLGNLPLYGEGCQQKYSTSSHYTRWWIRERWVVVRLHNLLTMQHSPCQSFKCKFQCFVCVCVCVHTHGFIDVCVYTHTHIVAKIMIK